ncbi:MAG: hypothetical protein ABIH46_04035 [Chloroflexota bacterium]
MENRQRDLETEIGLRCLDCKDHVLVHGRIECKRKTGCRLKSQVKKLAKLDAEK